MKKLLILLVALTTLFCLSLTVSAVCSEDVDLGTFDMVEKSYGDSEVKDPSGVLIGGYNPGGNNSFSAIFDNKTDNVGWAGGPAPRVWNENFNITFFYADSYLVEELTVYYVMRGANYGYTVELSNDGGNTWTEVGRFTTPEDFNVPAEEISSKDVSCTVFSVANGEGMMANAIRLKWLNGYAAFNVTFTELDIKAKRILDCDWDDGVVTTEATCGKDGVLTFTCSKCKGTREEAIPATGEHDWGDGVVTVEPTQDTSGTKLYTCSVCAQTKEEFLHATGHNWDSGLIIAPTCTEKGYTRFTCTDEGCGKTYNAYYVDEIGHSYDDGVETKHPTLKAEGELTYSCVREGCDESYTEVLPMATIGDSSFVIGLDNIISFEEYISSDIPHEKRNYLNLFDGIKVNASNSQSTPGGWFAPAKSTLTIVFDEEYYIINIDFYVWSNWNGATIEFFDSEGNVAYTFSNGGIQMTNGLPITIADCAGKLVKSMKITINSAKGAEGVGNCLDFQEFIITAHKHLAEGETERYDEISDCIEGGSYKKYCYVCEKEVMVETKPTGEHSFIDTIEYENGFDKVGKVNHSCENCSKIDSSRTPSIFYSYGYSVREFGEACVSHKVEVNLEALEEYNTYATSPLTFGMVAASTLNFEAAPLEIKDGAVTKTSDKVVVKDFSNSGYTCFEYTISNIPEFAYDTDVVLSPFVYDGKSLSYININSDSGAAYETVSYNGLTK
ncbi:MAG: hypothetical protein J6B45_00245 [Clostridia bacterium]|nr:hypothetical protein [Clostridia bacterium]